MIRSPQRPVDILESCFTAVAAQDVDRLVAHYTESYVLELPYWKPGEPLVVTGREAARAYLAEILAGQRMQLTLATCHWIAEEELLIAEYTSCGEFPDTGQPYQNSYVGYWFFEDERILRTREYYNPQAPGASAID